MTTLAARVRRKISRIFSFFKTRFLAPVRHYCIRCGETDHLITDGACREDFSLAPYEEAFYNLSQRIREQNLAVEQSAAEYENVRVRLQRVLAQRKLQHDKKLADMQEQQRRNGILSNNFKNPHF